MEILFPDRQITLQGETITVRELNFGEQLRHGAALAAFAAAFTPVALVPEDEPTAALDALAAHWESMRPLVALACGRDAAWIEALAPEEGEVLLIVWWSVNQGFFIRRLARPVLFRVALSQQGPPPGGGSLPRSSGTGIGEAN
ncbi:MAG: hypothetical protein LBS49_14975 [Candidatus Accumulibacter sp.]|nr:hypothetical protein [Accumulibacter sp.]